MGFLNRSGPLCSHACVSQQLFLSLPNDDLDIEFVSEDTTVDHTYDKELEKLSIKSLTMAVHITDQLRLFAQFHGYQDLALSIDFL